MEKVQEAIQTVATRVVMVQYSTTALSKNVL